MGKQVDYYPVPATNDQVIKAIEALEAELIEFAASTNAKLRFLKEALGARLALAQSRDSLPAAL